MFNIGGAELLVILLVALLVLGPNKLPQAARQVGHFLGEFRRIADGFQSELKSAMDDPLAMDPKKKPATTKPRSPGGPTDQVIDTEGAEKAGDADPAGPAEASTTTEAAEPAGADAEDGATPGTAGTAPADEA